MLSTQPLVHTVGLFAPAFRGWAPRSMGAAFPSPGQHKLRCRGAVGRGEPRRERVTEPGRGSWDNGGGAQMAGMEGWGRAPGGCQALRRRAN